MTSELWSEAELLATVQSYLAMMRDELAGRPINKAENRRHLLAGPLGLRSHQAIEYRMQNISAVLEDMGRPRIAGYPPARNVGRNAAVIARMITDLENKDAAEAPAAPELTLSELVVSPERIQGIKGVWGSVGSSGMCFGTRGNPDNPRQYYARVRPVAEKAAAQPFIITVGAGSGADASIRGRARDVVRVGSAYGPTAAILGEAEGKRLEQWPVAITAPEVYRVRGNPHLVQDLGFADLTMFSGLMDGVIRPSQLEQLWEALKDWPVDRATLPLGSNIYDDGRPQLIQQLTHRKPRKLSAEEGKRLWAMQLTIERDKHLAEAAKALNLEKHGIYRCEACDFTNSDKRYFDAHHPTPLSVGIRTTLAADLQILCPICHRRAHARGYALAPFGLNELLEWVSAGRP